MSNRIGQEAFKGLIDDLRQTHGANLVAIVLYGSAAAGDHIQFRSNYNLLIALNQITPEDLRLAQAPMREWQRLGNPLPVYFTVAELREAADVFPIEFHQMEQARVILYGQDPLASLHISDANLRHQTEYELRSKLLQLRRLYIPASVSSDKLEALLTDSLTSFATLFASVLILHGVKQPPITKRESVQAAVRLLGLNGTAFDQIFELRERGAQPLTRDELDDLFAAYMRQIESVIAAVDRLPGHDGRA